MRGNEIAKELNISTSALRHYESWGIIPKVERAKNGYRIYTYEHQAYFRCIRSMLPGFGMDFIKEIMPLVMTGEMTKVLWKINDEQVKLHTEKQIVKHTIAILDPTALSSTPKHKDKKHFSIGEVAKEATISTSAIRHWEKEGLLKPTRNKDSRFREFNIYDIRRVFIIRTVQRAVFSLESVKEVLERLDNNEISHTREIAVNTLQQIDGILLEQIKGIASFNELLRVISE